ncbi:MAG: 30S ribosomal protein S11 [Patescibacteria group bacterium]|nr:30S ribosomal protein S11 [Patescibacteria group bacterium]
MGKKRIIKKSAEELLKETEKSESVEQKATKTTKVKDKKGKIINLEKANIYIRSTYNNTIITLTDVQGNVVAWTSAGSVGFKGPKKATPFAASRVVEVLIEKIRNFNIREMFVFVNGVGSGRESAIRALVNHGLEISGIKDITPSPHNGCRPRKPRRV